MIGKQVKVKGFRGILNYLHDHESSRIIGGNMAGETPRIMSAEFAASRRLNPQLSAICLPRQFIPAQRRQVRRPHLERTG